ncbi:5db0d04c-5aeb-447f-8a2e-be0a90c3da50-CDS [Sclerotinia trifoliorum]|uniref:5db0d04c-5aeb-447f-8a2e-be0a90c3da50-CDS n=1 Tax=Sclerotinia trifoliorum TaxID=28548 RepID=A0A8H2ZTF6_9HELO|nr:5db0d04c-5aeb-447f-8a2e-be0a90c3da50-CDS [Sclerotinia trifoliorum]
MVNFFDLPMEIREKIYRYSIIEPKTQDMSAQLLNRSKITPYTFPHIGLIDSRNGVIDDDRMPGREFILVSRRVHEEVKLALAQELTFYWDRPKRFLHDCNSWGDYLRNNVRMVEFAVTPLITNCEYAEHVHPRCKAGIHERATCKTGLWETGLWYQAFGILNSFESIRLFELIPWKESWSFIGGLNMSRALTCLSDVVETEDGGAKQKCYWGIVREARWDRPVPGPSDPIYWEPLDDLNVLNHQRFEQFLDMLRIVRANRFLEREDRRILTFVTVRVNWLSNSFGRNKFYWMTRNDTSQVINKIYQAFGVRAVSDNVAFCGSLSNRTILRLMMANNVKNCERIIREKIQTVEEPYPPDDMFSEMRNDEKFQRHGMYSSNLLLARIGSSVPASVYYYKISKRSIDRNAANSYGKLRQYNRRMVRAGRLQHSQRLASAQEDEAVDIQQPGAPVRRRRLCRGLRPQTGEEEAAAVREVKAHGPCQKLRREYKKPMHSWRLRQANQTGPDQQNESDSFQESEAPIRRRRLCRGVKPQILEASFGLQEMEY